MTRLGRWLGFVVLTAAISAAAAPSDSSRDWHDAAQRDLAAIRAELNHSSPAPYAGEAGATFRDWINRGHDEASRHLPRVTDARSYYYLLKGYVGGFRDSHIYIRPTGDSSSWRQLLRPVRWPGFGIGWRSGAYRVVWAPADATGSLPPVSSRLASCDGVSADDIARARIDRFQGNLDHSTDQYRTAAYLLVDLGNPFVPAPPANCMFDVGGRVEPYALTYAEPNEEAIASARSVSAPIISAPLSLTRLEKGVYWLRIASLNNDQGWDGFLKEVEANRSALRSAPLVVIDLRGNGGGSSTYAYRLARIIWGEELVEQHTPDQGDSIWRVSPANREWLKGAIAQFEKDPGGAADLAYYRELLGMMDAAERRGDPTFVFRGSVDQTKTGSAANPVTGEVALLTDYACNSACLDLMDLYLKLPNTVHAGTETYADTIFMEETRVPLSSGKMTLVFGHKAIMGRERKSNQTYEPSQQYSFEGNPANDREVQSWVLNMFGS